MARPKLFCWRRRLRRNMALFGMLLLAAACTPEPDEKQIRTTIQALEAAAESGNRSEFLSYLSNDFSGDGGRYDQAGMGELMRIQLLRHTRVHADISNIEVELFDDRASVRMNLRLSGGPKGWLPTNGRSYQVDSGWRREQQDWRVASADWSVQ